MNRDKQMMSLEASMSWRRLLDEDFQATWLHITFTLIWFEEHYGVNPKVSVLTKGQLLISSLGWNMILVTRQNPVVYCHRSR